MHTDYLYKKEIKILEQELSKKKDKFPSVRIRPESQGQGLIYIKSINNLI